VWYLCMIIFCIIAAKKWRFYGFVIVLICFLSGHIPRAPYRLVSTGAQRRVSAYLKNNPIQVWVRNSSERNSELDQALMNGCSGIYSGILTTRYPYGRGIAEFYWITGPGKGVCLVVREDDITVIDKTTKGQEIIVNSSSAFLMPK